VERSLAGLRKAAALVVELYGKGATQYAARRVVLLKKQGDFMGAEAWQRVLPVIQIILRERVPSEPPSEQ
jgi:hypothetical protein